MRAIIMSLCLLGAGSSAGAAEVTFTEVTQESGLTPEVVGLYNHCVTWGDFDGDGKLDLFLGNFADKGYTPAKPATVPNQLFRQVANGRFERVANSPVEIRGRCSGAVFVDLDNDGDLDLYVSSNTLQQAPVKDPPDSPRKASSRLYRNDGGKFVDISESSRACPPTLFRGRDIGVLDIDQDGLLDLLVLQDQAVTMGDQVYGSRLFRNLGNLRFEDVTSQAGLPRDLWGAGIAVGDVNGDGRTDFFVAYSNRLFLSRGPGAFVEVQDKVFDHQPKDSEDIVVGAAFGDLDLDGDLDLATGTHYNRGASRVHVFLNDGGKFREITRELGIPAIPMKAPHPEIQDFDNDGRPDLYFSAWFAEGARRRPFLCRGLGGRVGLPRFDIPDVSAVKMVFDKNGNITNVPPANSLGMTYYVDGPAVDYDGDGRLDFFGGSWPGEPSRLFHNTTQGGHWLQVQVAGKKMNRMGLGAQVRVYTAGKAGDRQALLGMGEISVNGGYSSGRPAQLHFGLGQADRCDVEIVFPSRPEPLVQRAVKVNQKLVIQEP